MSRARIYAAAVALACGFAGAGAGLAPAQQTSYRQGGGAETREIRGEVPVPAPVRLRVVTEVGNVTLTRAANAALSYDITLRLRGSEPATRTALDAWPVSVRRTGSLIEVAVGAPSGPGGEARLAIAVPDDVARITVHSAVGNIAARGVHGALVAESAAGNVNADELAGSLRVETAVGNVVLGRIAGFVRASTAGGNITLVSAGAGATLESQGGNLSVQSAAGPLRLITAAGSIQVGKAEGDVVAETAGGNIDLGDVAGRVRSQTSGGNIAIARASGVQCQSGSGSLRLREVAGPVRAATAAGSIFARITASRSTFGDSVLRTGIGDITVLLPPRLPVTVDVDLTGAFGHRFSSDFAALEQAAHAQGGTLVVSAPLNGGGPLLRLVSTSSNISIRKEP